MNRIEQALTAAVARAQAGAPPRLAAALHHAVFPGGARIRPRLSVAVAEACGEDLPALTDASSAAVELLHCASLVHDDLPCFDDAATRRGRPSVQRQFGEAQAVLVGDALILLAFEGVARAGALAPERLPGLVSTLARKVGAPDGLVAGQAWELEPSAPLEAYHRAKTGSLFMAATMCGAISAGQDPGPWRAMGERLGAAYQVADDLLDALATSAEAGKPVGQDEAHGRPSAVTQLGVDGAVRHLRSLVSESLDAVPHCRGSDSLRGLIFQVADRLVPAALKQSAA